MGQVENPSTSVYVCQVTDNSSSPDKLSWICSRLSDIDIATCSDCLITHSSPTGRRQYEGQGCSGGSSSALVCVCVHVLFLITQCRTYELFFWVSFPVLLRSWCKTCFKEMKRKEEQMINSAIMVACENNCCNADLHNEPKLTTHNFKPQEIFFLFFRIH